MSITMRERLAPKAGMEKFCFRQVTFDKEVPGEKKRGGLKASDITKFHLVGIFNDNRGP